ncbi:Glutamate synthase [NADPH] large chain (EC [uncultured Gammaproteobacteria bacterium]|nr:Glutamate synthase [NADPH] large chain (EC [uncultured Gammaproteobacteria bacterium]
MKEPLLHLPKHTVFTTQITKRNCGVGFIAHIKASITRNYYRCFRNVNRMDHRGGCGLRGNTGDGAGILTNIPHEFFAKEIKNCSMLMLKKAPIAWAMFSCHKTTNSAYIA